MSPHLLIITIGLIYIVLFGGLSLLRREGLSIQFAIEVLGITTIIEVITLAIGIPINPIIYLAVIYLFTMRVRLLVDLANIFSNRGRQRDAINLLQYALRLYPDKSSRLVVLVNMGIVQLRRKNPESAITIFSGVLNDSQDGGLGIKYEAACRYNLGLAYQRTGKTAQAIREYNETMVIFPTSIYSKGADKALERIRHGPNEEEEEENQ